MPRRTLARQLITLPALQEFYVNAQTATAATTVEGMVQRVRMAALKEKTPYRLVIHDENAATPNAVDIERMEGGSFVTLTALGHTLPDGVTIQPVSMDTMSVGTRGACSSGKVHVRGRNGEVRVVDIESTCLTSVL